MVCTAIAIAIIALSLFSDDMAEKAMTEISIYDVDALALTLLVDFAYIGELVICEDNVQVDIWRQIFLSLSDIYHSNNNR